MVLFLYATFPTPPCHEGSADSPRTSINYDRKIVGASLCSYRSFKVKHGI